MVAAPIAGRLVDPSRPRSRSPSACSQLAPTAQPLHSGWVTRQERVLQLAVIAGAVSFAVEALLYVPDVFRGPAATRPYAINSVAKDVLFFALTAVAAADLKRWSRLIAFVILGHVVIVTMLLLAIATGNTAFAFPPPRWLADLAPFLGASENARPWIWLGLCAGATVLLVWL